MGLARFDAAGLVLAALLALWTLVASLAAGANPLPLLAMIVAAGGVLLVARGTRLRDGPAGPAAVVAVGLGFLVASIGGAAPGITAAGGRPLGYENANAAFFLQAAAAASMVGWAWSRPRGRLAGVVAAVVFVTVVGLTGSRAGLLLVFLLVPGILVPSGRGVRVWTAVAGVGFAVALAITVVIATGGSADRPGRGLEDEAPLGRAGRGVESEAASPRPDLWRAAVDVMGEHPVAGMGPGGFAAGTSGTRDADRRWVHNEFLEMGVALGIPGFVLLAGLFLWGFGSLLVAPPDRLTALAAGSMAAVGVHATVDYVLHFPAVTLAAAALLGTGQSSGRRRGEERGLGSVGRKALKSLVLPLGLAHRRRPGDLAVLLYHRVETAGREIDVPPEAFREQVAELARDGSVLDIEAALGDGSGGVVLTVDDGFRDFHERVLPVLVEHRVPAVLYLATGLVVEEGGDPSDGLSWSHLRDAVATGLVSVGSHTHSHRGLGRATEAEAEEEMRRSKELVEDRLGVPCRHFAYPWGVASSDADRVARRLFATAALPWGTNRAGRTDPHRLARLPVLRSDGGLLFRAKVNGMLDGEAVLYRLVRRGPWRRR